MQGHTPVPQAVQEAEIRRMAVQASPGGKKFQRHHLHGKDLGMVVHACHPSYGRKLEIEGSWSKTAWAKSETLSPK
jgi:hypothetical protein